VTLAVAVRQAFRPLMGDQFPVLTYFPALILASWFGGLGPTLLALGLSVAVVSWGFVQPGASLATAGLGAQLGLALYAASGLGISLIGGSMRRSLIEAARNAEAARREQVRLEAEAARRKWAEEQADALLEVQRRLRIEAERHAATLAQLFEQLPLGVTVFDDQLRISQINAYNAALCGQPPERLIGRPLGDVLPEIHGPEVAAQVEAQFRRVLETGEPLNVRGWSASLVHRPGEPYFADWSVRRIEDARGEPVGLLLTALEVTEHVARERQLHASEERFRTLADAGPALVWASGTDGNLTYFNRPWLDFTGRTLDQEAGDGWDEGVHPDDLARCQETYSAAFQERRPFSMSYRLRRHDGDYRWVLDHGAPWLTPDGTFQGYVGSCVEVHEQKLLEEQRDRLLAELEARHAFTDAILRQVPAGILVADAATGTLFLSNQAAHRIVHGQLEPGHRVEEYAEKFDLQAFHHDGTRYRPEDWPLVRALKHGEAVKEEEIDVVCGDGTPLTLSVNAGPVCDPSGRVIAAVAAFHDITDRKRAELALAEGATRFRYLADAIPQIVWMTMGAEPVIYLNHRWFEYTGLSEAETYRPDGYAEAVHPDDLARVRAAYTAVEQSGEPFEAEYRLRDREGRFHWFLGRAVPVRNDAGRLVCWFGTATDIDDRKRAEQAATFLADASTTLAALVDEKSALERIARLAVPHFADWCVVDMAGPDGRPRRLAVAHVDPEKVALAHQVHQEYPPDAHEATGVPRILRTGEAELVAEITDEMLVAGARDVRHLGILRELGLRSYMGVPLRGRAGTLGVISFIAAESGRHYGPDDLRLARDLAGRAAIAVENSRLYQELKDADHRKDEFLATLAHELRNPLAPIRNSLRLLASPRGVDHEAERARAERLVTHLNRLVDDLLDVSRINRGTIELRKEAVELAPIVQRAVEGVQCGSEARGHSLSVTLPERPVALHADPTRLEQVIWNLLSNAIKYTPTGGRIALTAAAGPGHVEILVADNGIGIAPERLPRIFDLFARPDSRLTRSEGGLGIGLGLVRKLVQQHGGTIQVHSDGPGAGSEFRVRLPVLEIPVGTAVGARPGPEPEPRPDPRQEPTRQPAVTDAPRRVLVVDDSVDAASSLAMILTLEDGHDTRVALDGPSALSLAADFRPDVVILDIGMPRMDGYEVARRIRAMPEARHARLLALSGWGQERDRQLSLAAGIERHLVKGVDTEVVRQAVADCLRAGAAATLPTPADGDPGRGE
jgi:PAS domain S-box-containing protein